MRSVIITRRLCSESGFSASCIRSSTTCLALTSPQHLQCNGAHLRQQFDGAGQFGRSRLFATSREEDVEQFKRELQEVMEEERESQKDIAKRKYDEWKAQQEQKVSSAGESAHREELRQEEERQEVVTIGPKDTHFNLGVGAQNENQMKSLIATLENSLKLQLLAAPYASAPVAKSYEELGMLCHQTMDFIKAIKYYRHSLSIHEKLAEEKVKGSTDSNPAVGRATSNIPTIGSINMEKSLSGERSTVTSDEFRYSFVTDPQSGGISSPNGTSSEVKEAIGSFDVARCLSYLGVCYRDAGKLKKAQELLTAALNMKYATVGQYHESTAETLNNLGALHHAEGNYREAADCYEDSIRILIGALGGASTTNPYLAMAYYNLGVALRAYSRFPEAIVALSKALRISASIQGTSHPTTVRVQQELDEVKKTVKEVYEMEVK